MALFSIWTFVRCYNCISTILLILSFWQCLAQLDLRVGAFPKMFESKLYEMTNDEFMVRSATVKPKSRIMNLTRRASLVMPVLQEKIVVWCTVRITWCDNNQILLRKIIRNIFISLSWSKAALAQQIMKKNLVKCCVCQTPRIYKHYDKKWYQVAALKQLNTTRLNRFLQQVNKSLVGSEEIVERESVWKPPFFRVHSGQKWTSPTLLGQNRRYLQF